MLDFANEYRIVGLYRRCMDYLDMEVDRATRCEETAEAGTDLLPLLAIVSKHGLEQHIEYAF